MRMLGSDHETNVVLIGLEVLKPAQTLVEPLAPADRWGPGEPTEAVQALRTVKARGGLAVEG